MKISVPKNEYYLFFHRHEFNVIVYYTDEKIIKDYNEDTLKHFHDAVLTPYSAKPLKQPPPRLLVGGIEAWKRNNNRKSGVSSPSTPLPLARLPSPTTRSIDSSPISEKTQDLKPIETEYKQLRSSPESSEEEEDQTISYDERPPPLPIPQIIQESPRQVSNKMDSDLPPPPPPKDDIEPQPQKQLQPRRRIPPESPLLTPAPQRMIEPRIPTVQDVFDETETSTESDYDRDLDTIMEASIMSSRGAGAQLIFNENFETIVGLRNLGNTSYLNCIIQCLAGSKEFCRFFLDGNFVKFLHQVRVTNKSAALVYDFASLIVAMYTNSGRCISPEPLIRKIIALRPEFKLDNEKDCHKCLSFLLSQLHSEMSEKSKINMLFEFPVEESQGMSNSLSAWKRYVTTKGSVITYFFEGQSQIEIKCLSCGNTATQFQTFSTLTLPIPSRDDIITDDYGSRFLLEDCFKTLCGDQVLQGEEAWQCPKCKEQEMAKSYHRNSGSKASLDSENSSISLTISSSPTTEKHHLFKGRKFNIFSGKKDKSQLPPSSSSPIPSIASSSSPKIKYRRSVKSTRISIFPETLLIHINRFTPNGSDKNDVTICYPLVLDLSKYSSNFKAAAESENNNEKIIYSLFSVSNHSGSLNKGHYTSLVKKRVVYDDSSQPESAWCYFDDEQVKIDIKHGNPDAQYGKTNSSINNAFAYILFYERII